MPFLDKAQEHFKRHRELRKIHVDELDEDVWYYPVLTVEELNEITASRQGGELTADALVATLVVRARNEDGSRMFHKADRVTLSKRVDINVISAVVNQMAEEGVDLEDATGN